MGRCIHERPVKPFRWELYRKPNTRVLDQELLLRRSGTSRHARTARTRRERVAFLKEPKSGARRDHSVVSAGVLGSVSINPKNLAMLAAEEIPASIMYGPATPPSE